MACTGDDVFTLQNGSQSVLIWAGDGDDTLVMEAGAELDGFFDGQAGLDTLDYSGFDQARSFSLLPALGETDGFDIRVDSITADALNMEQILGTALNDELIGRDAQATFNIYSGLDNYVDETSARVLYFDAIEDLYGGSQVDTFNLYGDHSGNLHGMGGDDAFTFSNTAQLTGYLDGGCGQQQPGLQRLRQRAQLRPDRIRQPERLQRYGSQHQPGIPQHQQYHWSQRCGP